MSFETLEQQLEALSAITQKLTEGYQADAERLRAEREANDKEFQARMKELAQQSQQAQEQAFTTGLHEWDADQLRGVRGWQKPDLELVKSLTPADVQALSAEQLHILSSHGKEYAAAVNQATARAIAEAQAIEQPQRQPRQVAPQVASQLEEMSAEDLFKAMNSPHGNTILQALGDMANG
jgi:vacuolar-type H+-ATPase subunit I/STV1